MKRNIVRKLCMTFVAVGLVAVTTYLGLVGTKLARGVSLAENPATQVVALQVLHAGEEEAGLAKVLERIDMISDGNLEIRVVETGTYDLRAITQTVVVSRTENLAGAAFLAERLGLDAGDVWYQPMEHNSRQATATLIVGPDFEELWSSHESKKELQRQS